MPKIPLEDDFTDVLGKAQRGLQLDDAALVAAAGVSPADLARVRHGVSDEGVLRALARPLGLGGDALVELAQRRWYPPPPVFPCGFAMFNTVFSGMAVNSYLLWDARSRQAAAFDTGADADPMLAVIAAEQLAVRHVFVTHSHEDHIAALTPLVRATGADVWVSKREPAPCPGARTFEENAYFHLGALAVKTLLTWGHSPGQTTYFVTGLSWPVAVVGDSLFACSMGGSRDHYREQHRHNVAKILTLPGNTVLAPGHGPLSTVAGERAHNPFFTR
jgi:glyoxylase-like metal-dependent hydrolase (beta-lactamase superfamily II)